MTGEEQNRIYTKMLTEAFLRINFIETSLQGKTGLPAFVVHEFCYLQLRLLCELIALACLVAYGEGDTLVAHKVGKQYAADQIFTRLDKLHRDFYPSPIKFTTPLPWTRKRVPGQQMYHEFKVLDVSPLPRSDLLKLYESCDKHLHRGRLKQIIAIKGHPLEPRGSAIDIMSWTTRLKNLLETHIIAANNIASEDKKIIACISHGQTVQSFSLEKTSRKIETTG